MAASNNADELLVLTSEIVSSFVANNTVAVADLPPLVQQVYQALSGLAGGSARPASSGPRPQPAVPVKKSVTPDYIICLEDGRKLKMLKRHLKTSFNLTPDTYRERWQLPPEYPMVAPNYARQRSSLAKKIGLGTKPRGRRGRG